MDRVPGGRSCGPRRSGLASPAQTMQQLYCSSRASSQSCCSLKMSHRHGGQSLMPRGLLMTGLSAEIERLVGMTASGSRSIDDLLQWLMTNMLEIESIRDDSAVVDLAFAAMNLGFLYQDGYLSSGRYRERIAGELERYRRSRPASGLTVRRHVVMASNGADENASADDVTRTSNRSGSINIQVFSLRRRRSAGLDRTTAVAGRFAAAPLDAAPHRSTLRIDGRPVSSPAYQYQRRTARGVFRP